MFTVGDQVFVVLTEKTGTQFEDKNKHFDITLGS